MTFVLTTFVSIGCAKDDSCAPKVMILLFGHDYGKYAKFPNSYLIMCIMIVTDQNANNERYQSFVDK